MNGGIATRLTELADAIGAPAAPAPEHDRQVWAAEAVDTLLRRTARIAALIERAPSWNDADAAALRLVLSDLSLVALLVRAQNTAAAEHLTAAAAEIRQAQRDLGDEH